MSKIIEIVFHNAKEFKNKMNELEPKIDGKHNALRLNFAFIAGNTNVEDEYFVLRDKNNNLFSKVKWDKIFSLMIYSDEKRAHGDPDDFEYCYSFINHKIQFLDEVDRLNLGFELLKDSSDDDEYFMSDELREAVELKASEGNGLFLLPVDDDKFNNLEKGMISEEDFIRLVQYTMKKKDSPKNDEIKITRFKSDN